MNELGELQTLMQVGIAAVMICGYVFICLSSKSFKLFNTITFICILGIILSLIENPRSTIKIGGVLIKAFLNILKNLAT
jgi:hypothetical protein